MSKRPRSMLDAGTVPLVGATETRATGADRGPAAVAQGMIAMGADMARTHGPFAGVGIGVPGLFSFDSGEIAFFTNLPGAWEGFPLRATIAEGLGVPATLINDARAFTLAEATVGAGRGCATVACVTLGTGVGGGLFINGELHFGAFGIGGELGHQIVAPDGPTCGCGNPGCMEALTRAPANRRRRRSLDDGRCARRASAPATRRAWQPLNRQPPTWESDSPTSLR